MQELFIVLNDKTFKASGFLTPVVNESQGILNNTETPGGGIWK
jgi:hypothetical protein